MVLIIRRLLVLAAAVVLVSLYAATDARAQQFLSTGRDTLRGLPGVEVLVEPLAPELEKAGLIGSAIQANVERYLGARSIPVYANQTANPSLAKPYLYVQVTGVSLARGGYALVVEVQVRQTLRSLVTASAIVNAMSWDQQMVITLQPGDSMQGVHAEVQRLVDRFVQDWKSVHPAA